MAWTESGLYANVLAGNLNLTTGYPNWTVNTNKMYLTTNSDTPTWQAAAASAIYATTYEVHDSSAWPAGGVACSALAAGSTDIVTNWTVTGTAPTTVLNYKASNVSVATTTLTGTYGGYLYFASGSTKYAFIGIYFGGSSYSTVSGTFAITWSSGTVATISCAS